MRDRNDEDSLRLDTVDQAVRKPGYEQTPESATEWATAIRELENPLVRAFDGSDEIQAEVLGLALEIPGGGDEFVLSFAMKLDTPHRSVERAFSKTSAAGIPRVLPDSSSSSLRSASSSQSLSASASESGSRLEIRRSARRARSFRGSLRAFDSSSRPGSAIAEGYHRFVTLAHGPAWAPLPVPPNSGMRRMHATTRAVLAMTPCNRAGGVPTRSTRDGKQHLESLLRDRGACALRLPPRLFPSRRGARDVGLAQEA